MLTDLKLTPVLTTWQEAFEDWLRLDGRKGSMKPLREKSIQAVLQDIRHFSKFLTQYEPAAQACTPDPKTVKAYFDWQLSGAAPASLNRRLASLRTLMRWSMSAGLIDQDPTARIPRIEMSILPPRAKDVPECRALAMAVKAGKHLACGTADHRTLGLRDRVIWSLMIDAGLRIGSVAALDIEGLHLAEGWLAVTVKGGKIGQIQIPRRLCRLLADWLKVRPGSATGAVITGWNGSRITTGQIRRRLDAISQAAGVAVKPHDLRHTYIYRLMDQALQGDRPLPAALDLVRQQACHSDVRTTQSYLRARRSEIRSVVEGL